MAEDWMPMRLSLWNGHPQIYRIAELCGISDVDTVIGKLGRVWARGQELTTDGLLKRSTPKSIDLMVNCPGFADAMIDVGWATQTEFGFQLEKWDEFNSKTAKRRIQEARRMTLNRLGITENKLNLTGRLSKKCEQDANGMRTRSEHEANMKRTRSETEATQQQQQENISFLQGDSGGVWGGEDANASPLSDENGAENAPKTGLEATSPPESTQHSPEIKSAVLSEISESAPKPKTASSGEVTSEFIIEFFAEWNSTIPFARVVQVTEKRKAALRVRASQKSWRECYKQALAIIPKSEFLSGNNDRGWKASVDWFLKPDSVSKILEGVYGGTGANQGGSRRDAGRHYSQPGEYDHLANHNLPAADAEDAVDGTPDPQIPF